MRKRVLRRIAAGLLIFAIIFPLSVTVEAAGEPVSRVRVGLASSSNHNSLGELPSAHLMNESGCGKGFRFGYYDDALNFVELGRTEDNVNQVAVLKTENLFYGYSSSLKKNTYSDEIRSELSVGCYHIRMPGEYSTWEEAKAGADRYRSGFPAWIDGVYQVRVGAYLDADAANEGLEALGEGEVVGTSRYGMSVVRTGTDQILFQFDRSDGCALGILPDVTGQGNVQTWFSGYKYRGGFTYQRVSGENLTVVNVLGLEDYVKGVVCYEMGRLWPLEALKTQAVCARTYVLRRIGYHENRGFDVCNSDSCQVYRGLGNGNEDYGPSAVSDQAVDETKGMVLWYKDTMADTYYSSCHGGASEDAKNIWGTDTTDKYPYLCGVIDPYEQTIDDRNPSSPWTVSYTAAALTQRIQSYGFGTKTTLDHLELTYSALGNVIKVKLCYANGQSNTVTPKNSPGIKSIFGLKSIRFTVNGQTVKSGETAQDPASAGYAVNDSGVLSGLDGLYVISGSGVTAKAEGDIYAISESGRVSVLEESGNSKPASGGSNEGGGIVSVSGSSYVFQGGGNGHQVGMSQFGANAMARLGFQYQDIVTFYFPGTYVGAYHL